MIFVPTYVCPNCGKIMKISGKQCPACQFSFTREMVDSMIVVCPDCLSKELKVDFVMENTPIMGITITNLKYSSLIEIAQEAVNKEATLNFKCTCCERLFEEQSFLLFFDENKSKLEKERKPSIAHATKFGCLPFIIALFIVGMFLMTII